MKDAIGQEIKLGDVLIHTYNVSGLSSDTMVFATKFGSTDKIGTTYSNDSKFVDDYVSYVNSKNVVVFTEQAIKFYGEEYVNKMRSNVVIHETPVREKKPNTRYFIIALKDTANASYQDFLDRKVFVVPVEGKTKREYSNSFGKYVRENFGNNFIYPDFVILSARKKSWGSKNYLTHYTHEDSYSLTKLKEFGLDAFINDYVSTDCLQKILDKYNS